MWPFKPKEKKQKRMYAGARNSRLSLSASSTSADAELYVSLRSLRDKSRALVRDIPTAKRAKAIVVNNVIGRGVGMQAQVRATRGGATVKRINDGIERAWSEWSRADYCHTGGTLHFSDLERLVMGEVFEAGECFIRIHPTPFGGSRVPMALEVIEADRIADDHEIQAPPSGKVVMGVEVDQYDRPLAYYIHKGHPSAIRLQGRTIDGIMRVPADQIIHLKLIDRWPQVRGVPAMHAALGRMHQLSEYENAALVAARIGASAVGFFEPTEFFEGAEGDEDEAGNESTTVEAGQFKRLPPGYKLSTWDPDYPHANYDPFTRAALRSIASAVGVSYESLSRDYSQSNYSSSRLALLDDRDLWRTLQAWWTRSFREPLHREWMRQAVLSGAIPEVDRGQYAIDPSRFESVRWKPRGWSWVDPTKEVAAFKEAERAGYMTKSDIIAATNGGADLEDVIAARRAELDALEAAGLATDTTNEADVSVMPEPEPEPESIEDEDGRGLEVVKL
jgi:lambda family phage portal protein